MARGVRHSDELRAQVQAALLSGLSLSDVARKYNLDKATVGRIKASIDLVKLKHFETQHEIDIAEELKLSLFSHLRLQRAITEVSSEQSYIRIQTAGDLAKLLEVSQNHAIRLLEAASACDAEEE